ncbi:Spc110p ASCRUDRAFT_74676 [Ascoidea rubescens DSM 1968]|uniref:Spindle pole body component 110 n=1 Tax=Ascoidea rubescens DSM 1968 TaxID=1344418 RepID=A0A1D2VKW3_9ASCO|nr:hypothetical protein ASCRUDRAFT_74676 [Ascoidea rubescens DSM 1968]ODV62251.1 hypothetical protein ASCRUDRAFT_74676 [Ascoidea rubescens DSM 1968]
MVINKLENELEFERLNNSTNQLKIFDLNRDNNNNNNNNNNDNDNYDKLEIKRLSAKNNELELLINDQNDAFSSQIKSHEKKIKTYKNKLSEKENFLEELENKFSESQKEFKREIQNKESEILELESEVLSKENKIKLLNKEIENVHEDHQTDFEMLKKKNENKVNSVNELLNSEIEELRKKRDELSTKLSVKEFENDDLTRQFEKIRNANKEYEEEIMKIKEDMKKMIDEYNRIKEEKKGEFKGKDKEILELRNERDRLESQLRKLNEDYKILREDMVNKFEELFNSKKELNNVINKLNSQIKSLEINKEIDNEEEEKRYRNKLMLLDNQIKYYRNKFHEQIYITKDLKFLNSFMIKQIKSCNENLLYDLETLGNVGIEIGIDGENTRETPKRKKFKTVALAVLAMVRLKNRYEKSIKQNVKMKAIVSNIESSRKVLINLGNSDKSDKRINSKYNQ